MAIDPYGLDPSTTMEEVVRAFSRSIRAMGYYDSNHPVFATSRNEAMRALQRAFEYTDRVTLGSGGRYLVVDEDGTSLDDGPSRALAERMFARSVVALSFDPSVDEEALSIVIRTLAEGEDRVRHAGGVYQWVLQHGAIGVRVLEVDFEAVFSSAYADLAPLVGGDPVAQRALEGILRYGHEREGVGEAVEVSLAQLSGVESLGSFLDDLLASGEGGVVDDPMATQEIAGPFGRLSGDDVADYAAKAYIQNQSLLRRQGASPGELERSAHILSNALVRLSPEARFALLRQLAGSEDPPDPEQEAAVSELSQRLDDHTLIGTMASALMESGQDADAVRAIGNVLRRVRPVEADRQHFLNELDGEVAKRGKRIDGVLWQEMESRAFDDRTLGMLELAITASREELIRYAEARQRGSLIAVDGQDILYTRSEPVEENWAMRAYVALLKDGIPLSPTFIDRCRDMLLALERAGAQEEALELLEALMERADQPDGEPLEPMLRHLLLSDRGRSWSVHLLKRRAGTSRLMGEVVLSALDQAYDRDTQDLLVDRLSTFNGDVLYRLGAPRLSEDDPRPVRHILEAALRSDPKIGVRLARIAMRQGSHRSKEVAIKSLIDCRKREAVALLALVSGWKNEKHPAQLLGLDEGRDRRRLHSLRLVAVGSLGMTHVAAAVRPLADLLQKTSLIESKEQQEVRVAAAQALLTNGTTAAVSALEEGTRHKKKAIRELCEGTLARRSGMDDR